MSFSKITIIGLGLIGGSLARALKSSGKVREVYGVDLDEKAIDYAVREGIIDLGSTNLKQGVEDGEIVVIATYVGAIPKAVRAVVSIAAEEAIITDVGSVKGKIVAEVEESLPPHIHFVGGHPIAGTERSGVWASSGNLFRDKRCILTPTPKTNPEALSKVTNLWEIAGASVFKMDADTHDRIFGFVSHLPHAVAYALVNSVASDRNPDNVLDFAGGGLRDFTRIGASSPDMWSEIFLMNRENLIEAIREFRKALEKIEGSIERQDLEGLKKELTKSLKIKARIDK